AAIREAMKDLLTIAYALRAESATQKLSPPILGLVLARGMRSVDVDAVAFRCDDNAYMSRVPAPTDEQLREHLMKYAAFDARLAPGQGNPLGFGYYLQNRVKLQALVVGFAAVREVVKQTPPGNDPAGWELAAYRYYKAHPEAFIEDVAPATQPATQPTTQPA